MKIEEMLAREAIRYTLSLYNNTGDRGAIAETVTAFTEDGVLEVPGTSYNGRKAIYDFYDGLAKSGTMSAGTGRPTRHHLTTSRIEFDSADRAKAWTYFLLVRDGVVLQNGIYVDQFVRQGERWLIAHRRVKLEYNVN